MDGSETTGTTSHAPPRVRFGDGDTDDMPILWAERGLTWLKKNRPDVFMDMMHAIFGIERAARRSRNGSQ